MIGILTWLLGLAMIGVSALGLSYLVSSIWEKERRAMVFGGLQFLVILGLTVLSLYLWGLGFFGTPVGSGVLIIWLLALALAACSMFRKSGANPKALEGASGLIVGDVKPFDEREMVFSLHAHLLPGPP